MEGLADRLRHHPHDSATEEEISTIFALSGPWSWQTIRGAAAEQAIDRLEAELGCPTDRSAAVASVRSVLGLTQQTVRHRELEGAIDAAAEARERALTRAARQRTTARSDELSKEWLAGGLLAGRGTTAGGRGARQTAPWWDRTSVSQEVARWR